MRPVVWRIAGIIALGFGIVGAALPLLPTTPFLLLAAFCFSRGSERLHAWLITHPRFGPAIVDWQEQGAISGRAKALAMVALSAAIAAAAAAGASVTVIAIQLVVAAAVATFLLTRPSPKPPPRAEREENG